MAELRCAAGNFVFSALDGEQPLFEDNLPQAELFAMYEDHPTLGLVCRAMPPDSNGHPFRGIPTRRYDDSYVITGNLDDFWAVWARTYKDDLGVWPEDNARVREKLKLAMDKIHEARPLTSLKCHVLFRLFLAYNKTPHTDTGLKKHVIPTPGFLHTKVAEILLFMGGDLAGTVHRRLYRDFIERAREVEIPEAEIAGIQFPELCSYDLDDARCEILAELETLEPVARTRTPVSDAVLV